MDEHHGDTSATTTAAHEEIAVFGGSFDPPHVAHVLIVAWVLAATRVSRVLVVPTFQHAFGKALSPFDDRFQMCTIAMRDFARVEVSRVEEELGGESRTLHTLRELKRRFPRASLRLVVGADVLRDRDKWLAFDDVCALAPLLVVGRATFDVHHDDASVAAPFSLPNVSSTEIRERASRGASLTGLVPPAVAEYVAARRLYARAL